MFDGYRVPASFGITRAVRPEAESRVAILCDRHFINELGTGGLLAPVAVCRDRD